MSLKLKLPIYICITTVLLLGTFGIAQAVFNEQINYQGRLTNESNVTVADGKYNMTLQLCTASDCLAVGDPIWTETRDCTTHNDPCSGTENRVQVTNGLFSVLLGSVSSLSNINFNRITIYLEVQVGGSGATPSWQTLTPRKQLGAVPGAFVAKNLIGSGIIDIDNTSTAQDATNINYNPSSGTYSALSVTYGSAGGTGTALTVTQSGTGKIVDLVGDLITTGMGLSISVDGLTTGTGLDISSTSTAGGASGITKLLNLSRSGANANASHTAYGIYSSVTNTGTTPTNIAGYFSASGATNNYAAIFESGNVGIGTTAPTAKLTVEGGFATIGDSYTKLLLHTDGSDASTTFKDETGKTVTANDNAQIDTAQSVFGGASGLFDGTGDYLTLADSADWAFGSGDFTIDFWMRWSADPGVDPVYLVSQWQDGNNRWSLRTTLAGTDGLELKVVVGGSTTINPYATPAFVINTWYHFALVRYGNTYRFYVNGTALTMHDGTNSAAMPDLAGPLYVANSVSGNTDCFPGWIDELRVSNGVARWTSNFTPPTSAYPYENIFYGNVGIGTTTPSEKLTVAGNVLITGSLVAQGGQNIVGNLTVTGHILPGTDNIYDLGSPTARWRDLYLGPTSLNIYNQANATDYDAITLGYVSNVATLHSTAGGAGTIRPLQIKTGTNAGLYMDTAGNVGIGTTAPTAKLDVSGSLNVTESITTIDSNTKLLLHTDGGDTSTAFTDSSLSPHTVTAAGDAQIDTAQSKFGGAGGLFDGTGDYLSTPASADWDFGTGDFTIDFWVRFNSFPSSGNTAVFYKQYDAGTDDNIQVSLSNESGNYGFVVYLNVDGVTSSSYYYGVITTTGVWYHLAAVRYNGILYAYINGDAGGTNGASTQNIPHLNDSIEIGSWTGAFGHLDGWIDEYRISKGIARWTSNFTPPTRAYGSIAAWSAIFGGNVGIGTTNPSNLLDVNGISIFRNYQQFYYGSTQAGMIGAASDFIDVGSTNDIGIRAFDAIHFATNDSIATKMIINSSGNVGIGTTTPTAKLDVIGGLNVTESLTANFITMIDSYTKLLLHTDGTDGSTTFTDSSPTPKTVTAYDNAQIDTAQSKFGGASGLFDGTSDYLSLAASADWAFGSTPSTVDFWIRYNSLPAVADGQWIFATSDPSAANYLALYLLHDSAGPDVYTVNSHWKTAGTSGGFGNFVITTPSTGVWYHYAFVSDGTNMYFFVGGQQPSVAQAIGAVGFPTVSTMLAYIGWDGPLWDSYVNGWLDEFRVSKGVARWTSDFTPPTRAYGSIAAGAATFSGNVGIGTTSPLAILDLTGTYAPGAGVSGRITRLAGTITEAASGNHALLAGLELTAPTITVGAATVTDTATLYVSGAPSATVTGGNYAFLVDAGDAVLDANLIVGGSTSRTETLANAGFVMGGDDLFVAGIAGIKGNVYTDGSFITGGTTTLADGSLTFTSTTPSLVIGGGGTLSITDGANTLMSLVDSGTYGTLTVNTISVEGGFATIGDSYTKLLLHTDGSDASTTFRDEAGKSVTANGNAQIDTDQSKFGGASGLFDGTGDYLSIPDSDDWYFGTGDFTIDFWVRFNALPISGDYRYIISQRQGFNDRLFLRIVNSSGTYYWRYQVDSGGVTTIYMNKASTGLLTNTWYHIALVRSGIYFYWFQDGVQLGTTDSDADSVNDLAAPLIIGNAEEDEASLNGWLDEVRVSKEVARWTSGFTPPTGPYGSITAGAATFSGNVGIGTISPDALLDIEKAAPDNVYTETLRLTNPSVTANGRNTINWYNSAGGMTSARIYSEVGSSYQDSKFFIDVADSSMNLQQRMVIDKSGNVGIGTASPLAKLDVRGDTKIAGNLNVIEATIDSYTKLLLHMDGTDGSTTFTDSGQTGYTVTANGNAQIDTAQSKFGGASGLFDGTSDYLSLDDSADWYFGTGDFTIDFWVRFNTLPASSAYMDFFGQKFDSSNQWGVEVQNISGTYAWQLNVLSGGAQTIGITRNSPGLVTNTWYHVALVRSGNSFYIFQDGIQCETTVTDTDEMPDIASVLYVATRKSDAQWLNGWLDEVRVSKGIARWTSNFTPPTNGSIGVYGSITAAGSATFGGNVGIGTTTPAGLLSVGATSQFQVNSVGDIYNQQFKKDVWTTMASAPAAVGNGGSITYTGGDYIYALRGGGNTNFYRYSISANSWTAMTSAPANMGNGGSSITYTGGDYIYALRGGGNTDFYRYSISANSWTSMTSATAAMGNGTSLVYTGGDYIYATRGGGNTDFYRYSISANSWTAMTSAPANMDNGCPLVYAGGDYIYAFRGSGTNEFYRYSISANSWTSMTVIPGTTNYGNSLTYTGGDYIYALRGNNSTDFYRYSVSANSWTTMTSTPAVVGTPTSAGSSLAYTDGGFIYATRGNGTTDFWRYSVGGDAGYDKLASGGLMLRGNIALEQNIGIMGGNVGIGTTSPTAKLTVEGGFATIGDSYTKLLLHADGSDASTTFKDETGKSVTANGNAQIDTAQSKFGGASGLFDGTGDYLSLADSADWYFGTGAFTIDGWFRFSSLSTETGFGNFLYFQSQDDNNLWFWSLAYCSGTDPMTCTFRTTIVSGGTGVDPLWETISIPMNTWIHLAVARSGNTWYAFKDGVLLNSRTDSTAIPDLAASVWVFSSPWASVAGWSDEFRVSKGIARWTSNFTPPTSAYSHENVIYGNVIVPSGRVGIGTTAPTHALTFPVSSTGIALYNTADQTTNYERLATYFSGNIATIASEIDGTGTARTLRLQAAQTGYPTSYTQININKNSMPYIQFTGGSPSSATGNRYQFTEMSSASQTSGTSSFLYLSPSYNQTSGNAANTDLLINRTQTAVGSGAQYLINAQVDGTSKFNVSNTGAGYFAGFATIGDSYTKLLLHTDGSDTSTTFKDETGKSVTANGDAQIDTAQSKFGGASGLFDGSGDYLSLDDSADWYFGTGNFTIDFWIRFNAMPGAGVYWTIVDQRVSASNSWMLEVKETGGQYNVYFYQYVSGSQNINVDVTSNPKFTTDTWYHIALVRSGTSWYVFQDGTQIGTTVTDSDSVPDFAAQLLIGTRDTTANFLNGWLDEFRVSKGVARWTSNFTPPTSAYSHENVIYGNVIVPSGRVGIGTTSPQAKLEIYATGNGTELLRLTSERAWAFRQLGTGTTTMLELADLSGGKNFVINTTGSVGIGTTSPQQKLTLSSGSSFATEMAVPTIGTVTCSITGGSLDGEVTYYFKVTASDTSSAGASTTGSAEGSCAMAATTTGSVTVNYTTSPGAAGFRIYKGTSAAGEDRYQVSTSTTSYTYTTDTGATLGSVPATTNAYVVRLNASGNSSLLGGKVGIGTKDPGSRLTVSGGSTFGGLAAPSGVTAAATTGGTLTAGTYYYVVATYDDNGLSSAKSSAVSCTVDGSATTACQISWTAVLGAGTYRVYGRATGAQDRYWSTTGTSLTDTGTAGTSDTPPSTSTSANFNGNVGMGTTSPLQRLTLGPDSSFAVLMAVPIIGTVTCSITGGSLGGEVTYYFKVTASDISSAGASTTGSAEGSCAMAATTTGSVTVNYTTSPGAAGFRIYKGISAAGEDRYQVSTSTTSYTYTTDTGATLGSVPATTNAYVVRLNASGTSSLLGGNVGMGTKAPGSRLTVSGGGSTFYGLAAPSGVTAAATTGGTLTAGTYYYVVATYDDNGLSSAKSSAVSCTVDGSTTTACQISWSAVSGAGTYRVYGRATGAQDRYWTDTASPYVDTGTAGTSDTPPSTSTSAYFSGNVGMGTTSPLQRLTLGPDSSFAVLMAVPIIGTVTCSITGGSLGGEVTYYFKVTASTTSSAGASTTGSAEGSCAMAATTTGSVTVNYTTSPGAAGFRIYKGTSAAGEDRYQVSTSTTSYTYTTDTGATLGSVPATTNAYVVRLAASGNSSLLGGNVGIGTTSPSSRLTVSGGGSYFGGLAAPSGVTAAATTGGTLTAGTYYYVVATYDENGLSSAKSSAVSCTVDGSATTACQISWTAVSGASTYRVYGRATGAQDRYWSTSTTSLTDTGTAGTSSPTPSSSSTSAFFSGNVGIGTASPLQKLTLGSDSTFAVLMAVPTIGTVTCSITGGSLGGEVTYYFKVTASNFSSAGASTTGSAEGSCAMAATTTGSVTVNYTTSPGAAGFRIYKGISAAGEDRYQVSTSTTSYTYTTDTGATLGSVPATTNAYVVQFAASGNSYLLGGNVGIGTASLNSKLTVSGGGSYFGALAAPTIGTVTCITTGGTLAAGTYYYKVSYLDANGLESIASSEASGTVASGTTGSCTVNWTNVSGYTSYRIYGRATGAQNQYWTDTATPYVDTGTTGTSGSPSSVGTSLVTTGNVGMGTASPKGVLGLYKDTFGAELLRLSRNSNEYVTFIAPGGSPTYMSVTGSGTESFRVYTAAGDFQTGGLFSDVSTGNVGIGDTSPGGLLTISATGNLVWGDINDNLIDNMESAEQAEWVESDGTNTNVATETSIVKMGSGSMKITTVAGSSNTDTLTKTISSTNYSTKDRVGFWIRATQTGQIISLEFNDDDASPDPHHNITIIEANEWQYEEWDISSYGTGINAVTGIIFIIDSDTNSPIFYIDQLRWYDKDDRSAEMFVDGSGRVNFTAENGYELYTNITSSLPSMAINSAVVELNQPLSVNVGGDVGIAYDLYFSNTGLASITSEGPLAISAGDPNHAENLTLGTAGTGDIIIDIVDSNATYGGVKVLGSDSGGYVFRISPSGDVEIGGSGSGGSDLTVKQNITLTGGNISINKLSTPTGGVATCGTVTSGGLNDGTYYYRVSAINDNGETLAATEFNSGACAGGAGLNKVTVSWDAVAGATAYKVYGRTTGGELYMKTVNAPTNTYTDANTETPAGALPSTNTTGGDIAGILSFPDVGTALTVSSNTITVTKTYHKIATSGNVTVNTINASPTATAGDVIVLRGDGAGTLTFGNTGNLEVPGGSCAMPANDDNTAMFIYDGSAWLAIACTTTNSDIAENYYVADLSVEAGDVVSISPEDTETYSNFEKGKYRYFVQKSQQPYEDGLMGMITTMPNIILGSAGKLTEDKFGNQLEDGPETRPVALAGRTPVKISLENGPIEIGDFLTSSSVPGVAMKATGAGRVIGRALEPFDGTVTTCSVEVIEKPEEEDSSLGGEDISPKTTIKEIIDAIEDSSTPKTIRVVNCVQEQSDQGKVIMFIELGWQGSDLQVAQNGDGQIVNTELQQQLAGLGLIVNEYGSLTVQKLTAKIVQTEELIINNQSSITNTGITIYDRTTGQPNCVYVADGALQTISGECVPTTSPGGVDGGGASGAPPEVCDSTHLNLCTTRELCEEASLYWYNEQCNLESEPVCSAEHLDLCQNEADCQTAAGFWYNDICNLEPENTEPITP